MTTLTQAGKIIPAKFIFTFLLLILAIIGSANEKFNKDPLTTHEISFSPSVQLLEISGNIEIILTTSPLEKIVLFGNKKDLHKVIATHRNGKLIVNAQNVDGKTKIYIPAYQWKNIRVNGNAKVRSEGLISTKSLLIELNGESVVHIRSSGNVSVKAADGFEVE